MMRYISFFFAVVLAAQQQLPGPVTIVNNASGSNPLLLRNFHATGLIGMGLISPAGSAVGSVGWSTAESQLRLTTFGSHPVVVLTSGTARARFDDGGLRPESANTYDFGSSSLPWKDSWNTQVYGETLRIAAPGSAFATSWRQQISSDGYLWSLIDAGGSSRMFFSTAAGVDTLASLTVAGSVNPPLSNPNGLSLGQGDRKWNATMQTANVVDLNVSGTCTGCGSGLPDPTGTGIVVKTGSGPTTTVTRTLTGTSPITVTSGSGVAQNPIVECATCVTTNTTQTISGSKTLSSALLASATTINIGTTGTPFGDVFFKQAYAEKLRIAQAGTSNGTTWRMELSDANTVDVYDSGNAIVMQWVRGSFPAINKFNFYGSLVDGAVPSANTIGTLAFPWTQGYFTTLTVTNTIAGHVPTTRSVSTSAPLGGGGTLSGDLTLTCTTCVTTNGTQTYGGSLTVSGNLYLRTFSGGDASCGSVADGWAAIRTDTNELQVCIGGSTKKVTLN